MRKGKIFYKPYRVKKRKSILKSRFFWQMILFLVLFLGIFYLILFSPFFQIKEVKIFGNEKVFAKDIQNIIENQIKKKLLIFETKSIFFQNFKKINKNLLEKFPQIENINLKRKFPNILIIQIKEREPVSKWCKIKIENQNKKDKKDLIIEKCYLLDRQGIVFAETKEGNDLVIKSKKEKEISLGQKVIEKEDLNLILEIKRKLKENLKIEIKEFLIVSFQRLNAKTSEDWQIYFNLKGDINWQIEELKILLKEKIPLEKRKDLEYIDLRFTRVYYKFR
jgi:cell division protein FtsQ